MFKRKNKQPKVKKEPGAVSKLFKATSSKFKNSMGRTADAMERKTKLRADHNVEKVREELETEREIKHVKNQGKIEREKTHQFTKNQKKGSGYLRKRELVDATVKNPEWIKAAGDASYKHVKGGAMVAGTALMPAVADELTEPNVPSVVYNDYFSDESGVKNVKDSKRVD